MLRAFTRTAQVLRKQQAVASFQLFYNRSIPFYPKQHFAPTFVPARPRFYTTTYKLFDEEQDFYLSKNQIRIKPFCYVHVLDISTNVTRVEIGPQTFVIRPDQDKVLFPPRPMIIVPPRHYCVIENPVVKDENGNPVKDSSGQYKLKHGDREIRFESEPFPLYPGEKLVEGGVQQLRIMPVNTALRLRAKRDFVDIVDGKEIHRVAGDLFQFKGPGTYIPRVEVEVLAEEKARVISHGQALKLRATNKTVDYKGIPRNAGEEWLIREDGAYLPGVYEEVVEVVNGIVLNIKQALHLRAIKSFTDIFGKKRKAGEEWLVTLDDTELYIPDVYEEVVGMVPRTTLTNREYCVICDPMENGKLQLGKKKLITGEASFFLHPGERLENGIQQIYILDNDEALLLKTREKYNDHPPGYRWMIYGPCEFVPPVEVEVVEKRKAIPLHENEGIYVRDITTGQVRAVIGKTYMLKENEELWEKELPRVVEHILNLDPKSERTMNIRDLENTMIKPRDKTRVVTYYVPHNSATQIFDKQTRESRIIFGPQTVMLNPHEEFTLLSLSGGIPKRGNQKKAITLLLGPDFMTDIIEVETSDHARLSLKVSYNWHFKIPKDPSDARLFQVADFIGDCCNSIASKVRSAVASIPFDTFHRRSGEIISKAIFGEGTEVHFKANDLVITSVDIKGIEPVDKKTLESLQRSVQLAIEIATQSQEEEAKSKMERQKLLDSADAEKARKHLYELQAESESVLEAGKQLAVSRAKAQASAIEAEAELKATNLRVEAIKVKEMNELEHKKNLAEMELKFKEALNKLEIEKAKELAKIEAEKFSAMIQAIGPKTISEILSSEKDTQVKLLQALGLKGYLITDGKTPLNLFNTAKGLTGIENVIPKDE